MDGAIMSSFDKWYEQHKDMIQAINARKDVAFYVWNNKPAKISAKKEHKPSEDFETFWKEYPNKTAKAVALVAWNKQKPPIIDVMHALEWQTKQENWTKDNGKYIPYAATYLNQQRWLDVPLCTLGHIVMEEYIDMNGVKRQREKKA
jgi:hypothetical protein